MSRTLPTLPSCGQPATIRIEIYSAAGGALHGSLDAAVYVCEQHGIEAVSAIQAAGFTAYRCTAPMPLDRPCGDLHTYPTASANLPFTLPTCDRPATVRVEAFTVVPGPLAGSLDAVVHVCTDHAPDAVTAIEEADLEAHVVPMAPDIARTCGSIHIYPTGNLASTDQHPRWCDRKDCERRGEHRSRARNVDTGQIEALIVDVALVQNVHPAAEPQVSLTGIDGAGAAEPVAVHLLLSIGQARTLRYRLATLIDLSKGGRR